MPVMMPRSILPPGPASVNTSGGYGDEYLNKGVPGGLADLVANQVYYEDDSPYEPEPEEEDARGLGNKALARALAGLDWTNGTPVYTTAGMFGSLIGNIAQGIGARRSWQNELEDRENRYDDGYNDAYDDGYNDAYDDAYNDAHGQYGRAGGWTNDVRDFVSGPGFGGGGGSYGPGFGPGTGPQGFGDRLANNFGGVGPGFAPGPQGFGGVGPGFAPPPGIAGGGPGFAPGPQGFGGGWANNLGGFAPGPAPQDFGGGGGWANDLGGFDPGPDDFGDYSMDDPLLQAGMMGGVWP